MGVIEANRGYLVSLLGGLKRDAGVLPRLVNSDGRTTGGSDLGVTDETPVAPYAEEPPLSGIATVFVEISTRRTVARLSTTISEINFGKNWLGDLTDCLVITVRLVQIAIEAAILTFQTFIAPYVTKVINLQDGFCHY